VIEDNDKVRILNFEGAVGTKTEMHSHPNIVAIVLSDSAVRFTSPDGQSMELELKAGMAMYMDAAEHATEVIGSSASHVVLVELK
jgi:quercetin dioxygenase-like cupin family protein